MPLPNYNLRAIRVARLAGKKAARAGAKKVEPEHLLVALLGEKAVIGPVLSELGIEPADLVEGARELSGITTLASRTKPRLSGRMQKILMSAEDEARSLHARSIDVPHLLLALAREGGTAAQFLAQRQATYDALRRAVRSVLHLPPPARCPDCGYDLRATPLRCPECGRTI